MFHDLADRVRAGETLIGTWLFLNDIGVAEVVAHAGYDFIMIDMEHSPTGFADLRNLIMAVEHHTAPMVRLKGNSPEFISAILDMGPAGVMVPRVNTAEQARFAVDCAKYQPLGQRGVGPFRLSEYGKNFDEVYAKANEKQMLWVQIEHRDAVANIEEIVTVPGMDLFFIGRGDLSHSLGHLGDPDHPEVFASGMSTLRAICKRGLPAGSAFGPGADLKPWHDAGMRVFTVAADFRFVAVGAEHILNSARDSLKRKSNGRIEAGRDQGHTPPEDMQ